MVVVPLAVTKNVNRRLKMKSKLTEAMATNIRRDAICRQKAIFDENFNDFVKKIEETIVFNAKEGAKFCSYELMVPMSIVEYVGTKLCKHFEDDQGFEVEEWDDGLTDEKSTENMRSCCLSLSWDNEGE
jgi:hypothetical protein